MPLQKSELIKALRGGRGSFRWHPMNLPGYSMFDWPIPIPARKESAEAHKNEAL